MNKYLNIVLLSFLSILTVHYKMGLVLYIPIVTFYVLGNQKNLFLILPSSFLALFIFEKNNILLYLAFMITLILFMLLGKRQKSLVLTLIYIFIVSFLSLLYAGNEVNLQVGIRYIIFSLISVMIYFYFVYNIEGALSKENRYRNFAYVEVVMGVIAFLGASHYITYQLNLGLLFAIFFVMYLSSDGHHAHSLFFSIITFLFLKYQLKIEDGMIIPLASSLYILPKYAGAMFFSLFCIVGLLFKVTFFSKELFFVSGIVSIIFELFRYTLIKQVSKEVMAKEIYQKTMQSIHQEVIGFASFLDLFAKEFSTPKEYNEKLSEGIQHITHYYCESCHVKKECYTRNRGKLYSYFKNMILYARRNDQITREDESQFLKGCPYTVEMRKSSMLIHDKLNLSASSNKFNSLVAQLHGISNVLRQYTIDNSMKTEISWESIYQMKQALIDYGYLVNSFEPKKMLASDFLFEVGITGQSFKEIEEKVEIIMNHYLPSKCSCVFIRTEKNKIYIKVVPKINFEIDYGYGSIAQDGNNVCGDNYLVRQLSSSKLVAAISDGMGKGYSANQESNNTLRLVDNIISVDLNTETALQILNTFYHIQDYLEKYSTLDFLEINRSTGEGTFYKMGASSSYVFHEGGSFQRIENSNLPFGLDEMVDAKKIALRKNDLIVMASDGVFENMENERELELFMKSILHLDPQKITYEILNYVRRNKVKANDDMSIIALKILTN